MPATSSAFPITARLRIGDTLTEGEDLTFVGVPSFAPEIVRRVRLTDAMKAKKLKEALAADVGGGRRAGVPPARRRAGAGRRGRPAAARRAEGAARCRIFAAGRIRGREFQLARWISSDDRKKLEAFIAANGSGVADDVDGDPVFLAKNEFYLGYTKERAEGINFSSVKDVKKKA